MQKGQVHQDNPYLHAYLSAAFYLCLPVYNVYWGHRTADFDSMCIYFLRSGRRPVCLDTNH